MSATELPLVYLDQNVLDQSSKGRLSLKDAPSRLSWVYTNEHFNETRRAGYTRLLDVLAEIRARRLELELDSEFRITGRARIAEYEDPRVLYGAWSDARSQVCADAIPVENAAIKRKKDRTHWRNPRALGNGLFGLPVLVAHDHPQAPSGDRNGHSIEQHDPLSEPAADLQR